MTAIRALPPDPIAPWAEIVPHAPHHMTVADLLDWPDDDGYRYEVVEGVLVRMAGTRPEAGAITRSLIFPLAAFVQAHGLGTVTLPDEVYDFERTGQPNTGLQPDIGFYYASRAHLVAPREPIPFAPDLAVEVASASQDHDAMDKKARRYLRGGTSLVWIAWADEQTVDVWHPGDDAPSATLTVADALDGESVVLGFTYPVARLFP